MEEVNWTILNDGTSEVLAVEGETGYQEMIDSGFKVGPLKTAAAPKPAPAPAPTPAPVAAPAVETKATETAPAATKSL